MPDNSDIEECPDCRGFLDQIKVFGRGWQNGLSGSATDAEVVHYTSADPNADQAASRADELVCIARSAAGEIVGVNTAYVADLPAQARQFFVYRMFVRPQDRHLHLARALLRGAVEALRVRATDRAIGGIVLVTENRKIMRRGGRRLLARLGWQPAGKDPRGLDVWKFEFDAAT